MPLATVFIYRQGASLSSHENTYDLSCDAGYSEGLEGAPGVRKNPGCRTIPKRAASPIVLPAGYGASLQLKVMFRGRACAGRGRGELGDKDIAVRFAAVAGLDGINQRKVR